MTESAHSLRNTILQLVAHLGLDPARIISRMGLKRRFDRIPVGNRTCSSVHVIDETGVKTLGIALPAFAIYTTSHKRSLTAATTIVVHVRAYRDGAGNLVPYADVDTAEALLKAARRPLTGRIYVPRSDGMVQRFSQRGDLGGIGLHPADI